MKKLLAAIVLVISITPALASGHKCGGYYSRTHNNCLARYDGRSKTCVCVGQ